MEKNPKPRRFGVRLGQVLVGAVVLFYGLALVGCATFQRKMIYFPSHPAPAALDRYAKSIGGERWKNAAGENIGWRKPAAQQPARGQLLVTHGNGGCAADRFEMVAPLSEVGGLDTYILEYPGYGDRAGAPTEQDLFRAADEAFNVLPAGRPNYLFGESLGTGVAAYLAGQHADRVAGIFLMAPYNRLTDVAQHHMKIFPVSWILRDRFESQTHLERYRGPVGILVGNADTVVPAKFGKHLFDHYAGPKKLWEIAEGDHQSIHDEPPEFWAGVVRFWQLEAK